MRDDAAMMPKLNGMQLQLHCSESGWPILGRGDRASCLHCDREISVDAVLDNPMGDWCPTEKCNGAGWGIDLWHEPWWREDGPGRPRKP